MSNPVFNASVVENAYEYGSTDVMTVQGATTKSGILLMLCGATAIVTWTKMVSGDPLAYPLMIGGGIAGFVLAIITAFKPNWSPITAPIYAVLEGLFLGGISAIYNSAFYDGIVIQAVCLTFGTMFTMLLLYRSGLVQVTQKFRTGVMAATGAIMLVYVLSWVLGMFGVHIPFIHSGGVFGICFSVFVVVIAALNLILDFDFIDRAAYARSPKFMEWYAAFGLMVTLVWLYLEILRLLAILNSDD